MAKLVVIKKSGYVTAIEYRYRFGRSPTLGSGSSPGLPSTLFEHLIVAG
jgi:hypothetical protein